MRRPSTALSFIFLIAGQALAAEPEAPKAAPEASPAAKAPAAPAPKAGDTPPAEYYVEPSTGPAPGAPPVSAGAPPGPPGRPPPPPEGEAIYEPPPPGFFSGEAVVEPPPPPEPHHIAPRTALWLGARVGWFMPFGNVWARRTSDVTVEGVPWRDYSTSGPMFELDAGVRLSRNYNLFVLWERAQLGSGRGDTSSGIPGKSEHGDTDFWGVGVRATSDPDHTGFVTELALGYRRARAVYEDGTELQFTDAPFEARLGVGADVRINEVVTLSPMFTLGVGSFNKIESVTTDGVKDATGSGSQADGHAWATLSIGGNFDLLGSRH